MNLRAFIAAFADGFRQSFRDARAVLRWLGNSGWCIVPIIAIMLAIYLLAACATPPRSKPILLVYESCAGRSEFVEVEIMVSPAPAVDCVRLAPEYGVSPAWFALQMPVACALRLAERALIVLPFGAPRWMVEHEISHVVGLDHMPFTWGPMQCP